MKGSIELKDDTRRESAQKSIKTDNKNRYVLRRTKQERTESVL